MTQLNNHGNSCPIDCRTAETPSKYCKCSCNGSNHGSLSKSVEEYGETVELDERNPFAQIYIDEEAGPVKEKKRETLADSDEFSIDDIEVGDKIDVLYKCPKRGWVRYNKIEIEKITDTTVGGKKPDGFYEDWTADKIPVSQDHFRRLTEQQGESQN